MSVRRAQMHPHGIDLGHEIIPLWCGAMHYWRLDPADWGAGLDALRSMGMRVVDTYVPWGVHEQNDGSFDFGTRDPRLDVRRFLREAHARGFKVVVRPGPHINAELTYFGLPERIVWNQECQARTPRNNPVMLPMLPVAFPVPSYASRAFFAETKKWFAAVGGALSTLRFPEGPIVMVQVDNEGALYFRDGAYDQDYHPDAIADFRRFLGEKYGSGAELSRAWSMAELDLETVMPPMRFDAVEATDLARHLDWMEFHEELLAAAMGTFREQLEACGLGGVPTLHNFPLGEAATPLNAARLGSLDLIGLDYYHRANPREHPLIVRRTTELASRAVGLGSPAFAAEIGAGFPPFFSPIDEKDALYTLLTGLAYGLRGYNLYMAVERDRWVGAPIDAHGRRRPFADAFTALNEALERTKFHTLRRRCDVRLVMPRALRRLARATHAFGPVTPAVFNVLGASFEESCLEEELGLGEVATIEAEAFLRAFEGALTDRGVPFAYAGGESLDASVAGARWIVCATAGGVKPGFLDQLRRRAQEGVKVTVGPHVPQRDGSMRLLETPVDVTDFEVEPLDAIDRAGTLVARRIEELGLITYAIDPDDAYVTVHEDDSGAPRVVFVMNPTAATVLARVSVAGASQLVDAIAGASTASSIDLGNPRATKPLNREAGGFRVEVPARSVRMLEVVPRAG